MDSYKMEHPMYEFLCKKKTNYKTRFLPYTHGMIDIQELRLYVNLILHTVAVFYIGWGTIDSLIYKIVKRHAQLFL